MFKQVGPYSWKINIDNAADQKLINYWGNLVRNGDITGNPIFTPAFNTMIAKGTIATLVGASWYTIIMGTYAKAGTQHWATAELPQFKAGQNYDAQYGGSGNMVLKATKHPLAAEILALFTNLDVNLAETPNTDGGGGYIAANVTAASAPGLAKPVADFAQNPFPIFLKYASDVASYIEWSPWEVYLGNAFTEDFSSAVAGHETFDQALTDLQNQVVTEAQSEGYTVVS